MSRSLPGLPAYGGDPGKDPARAGEDSVKGRGGRYVRVRIHNAKHGEGLEKDLFVPLAGIGLAAQRSIRMGNILADPYHVQVEFPTEQDIVCQSSHGFSGKADHGSLPETSHTC